MREEQRRVDGRNDDDDDDDDEDDDDDDRSNLRLLHRTIEVIVGATANPDAQAHQGGHDDEAGIPPMEGVYKLHRALHPSLAPLVSVTFDRRAGSVVSVFDITPSRHRSLHELLRTEDFLARGPLLSPHFDGGKSTAAAAAAAAAATGGPSWSLGAGGDRGDPYCSCRGGRDGRRYISTNIERYPLEESASHDDDDDEADESFDCSLPSDSRTSRDGGGEGGAAAASADEVDRPPPKGGRRVVRPWKLSGAGSSYRADVADLRIRFLAMQLFHAATFCHANGVTLGDQLSPERLFVQDDGWIRVVVPIALGEPEIDTPRVIKNDQQQKSRSDAPPKNDRSPGGLWRSIFPGNNHLSEGELTILPYPGYGDVPTVQWQRGQLTNLCYLMMLNSAAGRTVGDPFVMPILPWVTDFSTEIDLGTELEFGTSKTSPWRDLSRSKFR
jgi:WD repeat-containing protein 81